MSLNVYLAAPYAARDALQRHAYELVRLGHHCTSSWLDESSTISPGTVGPTADLDDVACQKHAAKDLLDIRRSDVLVVWSYEQARPLMGADMGNSGGRHVETGVAIASGLPVILIGQPEHIFHRALPSPDVVEDWHGAVVRLVEIDNARPQVEVD